MTTMKQMPFFILLLLFTVGCRKKDKCDGILGKEIDRPELSSEAKAWFAITDTLPKFKLEFYDTSGTVLETDTVTGIYTFIDTGYQDIGSDEEECYHINYKEMGLRVTIMGQNFDTYLNGLVNNAIKDDFQLMFINSSANPHKGKTLQVDTVTINNKLYSNVLSYNYYQPQYGFSYKFAKAIGFIYYYRKEYLTNGKIYSLSLIPK